MRTFLILLSLSVSLTSCEWLTALNDEGTPVARVKEKVLYLHDVKELMPEFKTQDDSVQFIKNFSKKWVEEQIMLDRAEYNLTDDLTDIEEKVRTYRNSLLIYAYEQALVAQKLDTLCTDLQIANYYNKRKEDFMLRNDIFRLIYLKLDPNTPRLDELKSWFNLKDPNEKLNLMTDYALQFGLDYSLDPDKWWSKNDLLRLFPVTNDSLDIVMQSDEILELRKGEYLYLIEVLEQKQKNSPAPINLVKPDIRNIMLNERKIGLVKELRENLIKDASEKNHIEYYSLQ